MNAYRPFAFESAAVLAHAANSHRELVGALRFLTAAASALLREPGAGEPAPRPFEASPMRAMAMAADAGPGPKVHVDPRLP